MSWGRYSKQHNFFSGVVVRVERDDFEKANVLTNVIFFSGGVVRVERDDPDGRRQPHVIRHPARRHPHRLRPGSSPCLISWG